MARPTKTLPEDDGYVMTANPAPASFDDEGGFARKKQPDLGLSKKLRSFQMKTIARTSSKNAGRTLARILVMALLIMTVAGIAAAQDSTTLVFKGGIGVQPITGVSATGTVNLNLVRGVSPAGPWRISSL